MKFFIILENNDYYLMKIGWNFHKYKIKNGYLYRGLIKLGKIVEVRSYESARFNS